VLLFFIFTACGGPVASSKNIEDKPVFEKDSSIRMDSNKSLDKSLVMVSEDKSFVVSDPLETSCTETETIKFEKEISHLNETDKAKHKIERANKKTDCMIEYLKMKDLGQANKSFQEHCK
jgi:hypothetical protein